MEPKHLKTPAADLVLVRFTEFNEQGLAHYRLWRMPAGGTAGPTIANFMAPGDGPAELFVEAWHAGRSIAGNRVNLAWYTTLAAIEDEKRAAYEASRTGNHDEASVALEEYKTAQRHAALVQQALVGNWPSLA